LYQTVVGVTPVAPGLSCRHILDSASTAEKIEERR